MRAVRAEVARKVQSDAGKRGLIDHEPWKVLAVTARVSATVFGATGVVLGYLLARIH